MPLNDTFCKCMDGCRIQSSQADIEAQVPRSFDSVAVVLDQTEPMLDATDPVAEDNIEIEDPGLVAAASERAACPSNQPRERSAWVTAFMLAVFIHVVAAAICFMLAIAIRAPRVAFTQGSGSSENGLVSEKSNQTESRESGVPGPIIALPDIQKSTAAEPPSADVESEPRISREALRPITVLASDAQLPDAVIIGIRADSVGPMPARHRAVLKEVPASAVTDNIGTHTLSQSPSGKSVATGHSLVAPRGAGHPGVGAEGSGFDSRGLPLPEYPSESKRRHEEGLVELDVQVKPDGSVAAAQVLKDSGYPRLNNAALASIRSARFTPAMIDGVPVPARVIVPYRFILQ